MNTDTMIALAAEKRTEYLATANRERRAASATAGRPERALMRRTRVALGAVLISAGSHLQGVATALPEPPAIGPALSTGTAGQ